MTAFYPRPVAGGSVYKPPLNVGTWYPRTHNTDGSLNETTIQAVVRYLCDDPANPNDTDTPVYERGYYGEADYSWFRTHPFESAFSLGMDDAATFDVTLWAQGTSDRYYQFVARVAEEVARFHPDKHLGVLLYQRAREPFTDAGLHLPDNVYGYLTQSTAQWWQPARDANGVLMLGADGEPLTLGDLDRQTTAAWAGKMPHLLRYDYPVLATITPQVLPHLLAESIGLRLPKRPGRRRLLRDGRLPSACGPDGLGFGPIPVGPIGAARFAARRVLRQGLRRRRDGGGDEGRLRPARVGVDQGPARPRRGLGTRPAGGPGQRHDGRPG